MDKGTRHERKVWEDASQSVEVGTLYRIAAA